MIEARATVDTDALEAIQEQARKTPALMKKFFELRAKPVTRRFLDELKDEPRPAVHPFVFATPRSRRWYFYALREGLIPTDGRRYKRSGLTIKAWRVIVKPTTGGGELVLENDQPHAQYVYGPRTVPGHLITGWPQVEPLQEKYSEQLTEVAIETWYTVSDPYAGVNG